MTIDRSIANGSARGGIGPTTVDPKSGFGLPEQTSPRVSTPKFESPFSIKLASSPGRRQVLSAGKCDRSMDQQIITV